MSNTTITAVPGVVAGHWTHASATTGSTVFLFPGGARGAVCIRGHATGSRELDVLRSDHVAQRVDAICLTGGSAFGLAACDGVVQALEERGVGFETGFGKVPIVAGAVLFDLAVAEARPDAAAGTAATDAASTAPLAFGSVGAGAGARTGKITGKLHPGGFASSAETVGDHTVGAAVALNAFGCVRDPDSGAWLHEPPERGEGAPGWGESTTLAVVATDAPLSQPQCKLLADMAAAALSRTIYPAYTGFDGDIVFGVSTGAKTGIDPVALNGLAHHASLLLARSIVLAARSS